MFIVCGVATAIGAFQRNGNAMAMPIVGTIKTRCLNSARIQRIIVLDIMCSRVQMANVSIALSSATETTTVVTVAMRVNCMLVVREAKRLNENIKLVMLQEIVHVHRMNSIVFRMLV
jgi:hypothetical protein